MDGTNQAPQTPDNWSYTPEVLQPVSVASPPAGSDGAITWTASEFIAHQKTSGWYGLLAGGAIVVAIIVWLLTKDVISALFIVIAAGFFAALAGRQPRELTYRADSHGLYIGQRHLTYNTFRSFSVVRQGAFASIVFMPMKRFGQSVTIYYDPQDESKIVDLLGSRLPQEPGGADVLDRLMWRIRF